MQRAGTRGWAERLMVVMSMGREFLWSLEEDEGVFESERVGRPKHMLMVNPHC